MKYSKIITKIETIKLTNMKRNYYLWIAAAAAIVAGCAQENVLRDNVSESEQALITFDTYHSRATKAPIDNEEDLTYDNGGFGVYAFKHVDPISVSDGIIDLSAIADEFTNPVFDNTMTWFNPNYVYVENGSNNSPFFTKYIYEYPRYWDKQMNYTFFAYAPHASEAQAAGDGPEVKGVRLDVATGKLFRNDIHQVQSACSPNDTTITNGETTVTKAKYKINEEDIIDYLLAPVVPGQRWHSTNQTEQQYDNSDITVGFELHHILSQLNVSIKAKNEEYEADPASEKKGHEYKGIKSIYITKLEITNLPPLTNLDENFIECQQNKVDFAHIYAYSTFQPLTFNPGNYNNKSLAIVNPVTSTTYSIDGEEATANPLYILAGGTDLGGTTVGGYIDQNFRYYVAPNLPTVTGDLHDLNIDYYIEYLDGKAEKYSRTIRLDTDTFHFDEMVASYIYNIGITISLDQIYITVDDVVWNTDPHSVNVSGDDL